MYLMVSAVKGLLSAVHAEFAPEFAPAPPPEALGSAAVRPLPQGHRAFAGRGAEVLENGIHANYGRR